MILAKYREQILGGPEDRGRIALRWYRIRLHSDPSASFLDSNHIEIGSRVMLKGLVKKTTLNGRVGTVADLDFRNTGNLAVRLDACSWDRSRLLQIRRVNVLVAANQEEVEISFDDTSSTLGTIKESYEILENVKGGFYQPSVDDVGTRIGLRVQGLGENSQLAAIASTSVLCLDPEVKRVCEEKMKEFKEKNEIMFEIRKCSDVKSCMLVLMSDRIEFRHDDVDDDTTKSSLLRLRSKSCVTPSPSNAHHFTIEDVKLTAKTNIQRDIIIRCCRLVISDLVEEVSSSSSSSSSSSISEETEKETQKPSSSPPPPTHNNNNNTQQLKLQLQKIKDENINIKKELKAALKSSMNHIQSLQMKDSRITDLKSRLKAKDKIYNQMKSQIRDVVETRNTMEVQEIAALEKMQSLESKIQEHDQSRDSNIASEFEDTKRLLEESSSRLRRYRSLLQDSEKRHDEQLDEQQIQIESLETELTEAERRADEAVANMVNLEWKFGESEISERVRVNELKETRCLVQTYEDEITEWKHVANEFREENCGSGSSSSNNSSSKKNKAMLVGKKKEEYVQEKKKDSERAALIAERNALRQKCKSLKKQLAKRVDVVQIHNEEEKEDENDEISIKRILDMVRGKETILRDRLNAMFPSKKRSNWLGDTDKKQREEFVQKIRLIGAQPPETEGDFHAARVYIDAKKMSVYDCEQWLDYLRLKQAVTDSNKVLSTSTVLKDKTSSSSTTSSSSSSTWFSSFGASGQLMETNKQLRQVSAALSKKVSRLDGRIADLELELHMKDQKLKMLLQRDISSSNITTEDDISTNVTTEDDIFGGMSMR